MARRKSKTLKLQTCLGAEAVGELHRSLLGLRGGDVRIDAGDVEWIGAQAAQVLVSALATWREDGKALTFENATEGFAASLQVLGLPPQRFGMGE